jgi:pimeloyl-ACP methyl ester carboxylesterase
VLLFFGIEDSVTPIEQGQMLDQMIPNSEFEIIGNATHGAARERAEQADALICSWAARNRLR